MKKIFCLAISLLCFFSISLIVKDNVALASTNQTYVKKIESDAEGWEWEGFSAFENDKVSNSWEVGSMQSGAVGEYTFKSNYVALYGYKGLEGGNLLVSIDGEEGANVSLYNSQDLYKQKLVDFNLDFGWHTIKITSLTDNKWHSIDYMEVNLPKLAYEEHYNLALIGDIICSVPNPTGGGNKDLNVIRNEKVYPVGSNGVGRLQYDSFDGSARKDFYMGYEFKENITFNKLVFQEGETWATGGWFANGAPRVQVRNNGTWKDVTLTTPVNYPISDNRADFGVNCEVFTFTFEKIVGDAIRIIGLSGGTENFVSVAQIEVYGSSSAKTLHDGYNYKDKTHFGLLYSVECSNVDNGIVSCNKTNAEEGEVVIITAVANEGYKLKQIMVNGVATIGNTFVMPEQNVVVEAVFEKNTTTESYVYASLTIKDNIFVNVYVDASKYTSDSEAYVELTYNSNNSNSNPEEKTDIIYLKDLLPTANGIYKITRSFASAQINDKINIRLYDSQNVLLFEKEGFSIKEYCLVIINDNTQSKELINLCKSIINLGNQSKKYFNYDSSVPTDDLLQIEGVPSTITSQPEALENDNIDSISVVKYLVEANSGINIRIYFSVSNGENFNDCLVSLSNASNVISNAKIVKGYSDSESCNYVEISGIEANNLDESFILTLTYKGQKLTIKYSVLNFIYKKAVLEQTSSTQEIKDLLTSIYVYNYCVDEYFFGN